MSAVLRCGSGLKHTLNEPLKVWSRFLLKPRTFEFQLSVMRPETLTIELTNSTAISLLENLERLNVIRILRKRKKIAPAALSESRNEVQQFLLNWSPIKDDELAEIEERRRHFNEWK